MTDVEIQEVVVALQKAMGSIADASSLITKYKEYEERAHPTEKTPMFFTLCDAYDVCSKCGFELSDAISRLEDHIWN